MLVGSYALGLTVLFIRTVELQHLSPIMGIRNLLYNVGQAILSDSQDNAYY